MSGIYLEDFDQITKQYDFDEYIDYDFEDGTFDRSYMNSDATMYLDIMYLPDTHEVMNGEIIPAVLCPKDLQESFIKDVSQMLCPKGSAEEVTKWVEENLGKEAEIEIDGFIYERYGHNRDLAKSQYNKIFIFL